MAKPKADQVVHFFMRTSLIARVYFHKLPTSFPQLPVLEQLGAQDEINVHWSLVTDTPQIPLQHLKSLKTSGNLLIESNSTLQ